jgi:hypothetical protein
MQNAQVVLVRTLRTLRPQGVVGQPKLARREQIVAVAIVGERARLAHQPVDHVPILDAVLAPASQTRQLVHAPLRVPNLDPLGEHAGLDPLADQSASHRVDVLVHMDGATAVHAHPHALARLQTPRRQRPQHGLFLGEACLSACVLLHKQLTQERLVGRAVGKIPAATQEQRLLQGTLEAMMTLLDVAVLVTAASVDGLALQAIMLQQRLVTLGERLALGAGRDGRRQSVGAMTPRHAAQFPQGVLQTCAQALQALGEAEGAGLPVRVGQHKVVDQMRQWHASDGHAEAGAMREIAGAQPARLMHLGEEHFFGRTVQGMPLLDAALEGPQLTVGKAARITPLQFTKQRLGLQAGGPPQLLLQVGPDLGEEVGPRSPVVLHDHLAGQLAEPPVLPCRLGVQTGLGRHQTPRQSLSVQAAQPTHLLVSSHHPKPPCQEGLRIA